MESVQLALQLFNLRHILVLNPEVVHLDLDGADLSTELVLLLGVANDRVEHAFQILDLVIDLLNLLVFRLLEDRLLHLYINFLDFVDELDRGLSHILDLLQQAPNFIILALHILDKNIDAL